MRINRGYIDASIYVILTSISFVFLNKLCQGVDPAMALFIMSAMAILNFNLLSLYQIKHTYSACLNNKWLFLIMSGSLGLDWVCMLYASYLADPFVSMGALFIFLAIIGFLKLFMQDKNLINIFSILLLILSVFILYFGYQVNPSQHLGYGIILGAIAGIAFYIYIASSHAIVRRSGLTTMQVLATRFWILFLGSAIFIKYDQLVSVIIHNFWELLLITYGSLIIPIYFNQRAITRLGSNLTAVIISFVPPVTYIFYAFGNHSMPFSNVYVCIVIAIALVLPNLTNYLKLNKFLG